jgi:hypothetical protein
MRPRVAVRQTHDYVRHGTNSLFTALNVATPNVIGRCHAPSAPVRRNDLFFVSAREACSTFFGWQEGERVRIGSRRYEERREQSQGGYAAYKRSTRQRVSESGNSNSSGYPLVTAA